MWKGRSSGNRNFLLVTLCPLLLAVWLGCTESKPKAPAVTVKTGACQSLEKLPDELVNPAEVSYGDKLKFLGVNMRKVPGGQLEISYFWRLTGNPGEFREVFVHFTGPYDELYFQNDHTLCLNQDIDGLKGKIVRQTNTVNVPQSVKGKDAVVKIGLYDVHKKDYPRMKVTSSKNALVDDKDTRAVAGKIRFD